MTSDTAAPLAKIKISTGISIIIPTYQERDNIPHILARIDAVRAAHDLDLEVLFMDDDSQDGSAEAVEAQGFDWARMIVRTENRGLSPSVIDGFRAARHPVLICMDCDLSHPPEAIPQMVGALGNGQDFVVGSRYVSGGGTDDDWGMFRWLNSVIATLLARPLTRVSDPMSGFFALRKADFDRIEDLNPVGYKIALELIVKGGFDNVSEVPIFFRDRVHGESKLSLKEQLLYIKHLRRLYVFQFTQAMYVLQFAVVGASGVVVNLGMVTLLRALGFSATICLAAGILVSVCTNFLLNRRFTFSYARDGNLLKQFAGFVGTCAVGGAVNYGVALLLYNNVFQGSALGLQTAALVGIAAGMVFNFLGSRYLVFRKRFISPDAPDRD